MFGTQDPENSSGEESHKALNAYELRKSLRDGCTPYCLAPNGLTHKGMGAWDYIGLAARKSQGAT